MKQIKEVVITGVGTFSPLGKNATQMWENSVKEQLCIDSIPNRWLDYAGFKSKYWAPLPKWSWKELEVAACDEILVDPLPALLAETALEALRHANISLGHVKDKYKNYRFRT